MKEIIGNTVKIMSSREIASLTDKRHSDVKRDIRVMLEGLAVDVSNFAHTYIDASNRSQEEYLMPKDETLCLMSGYDVKARMTIIKRWQELEQEEIKPQFQIPTTLSEALQLAADQAKQLEEQAPKVAVYEKLANRKGDVSTTILAKQLGTSAIKLNQFLREIGAKWQNADLPKAGFMEWFNVCADVKNGHEFTQCLVTPLGQIEIAKRWEK